MILMHKKVLTLICVVLCALVISACGSDATTHQTVSAAQAREMMHSGEAYVLLDVRTAQEHAQQRIEGAVLIPYDELRQRAPAELTDMGVRILIFCRTGRRSEIAANTLAAMGYARVYDFGGIVDWPFETVGE